MPERREELILPAIGLAQRLQGVHAVADVAEIHRHAAALHRRGADLEPAPVVRVEHLHALGGALGHYAVVHVVDRVADRVREGLVPGLAKDIVALAPQDALGGGVHVRHAPVAVVGDEAFHQTFEVIRVQGHGRRYSRVFFTGPSQIAYSGWMPASRIALPQISYCSFT